MTNREQLMQKLEKAPDETINTVIDFLRRFEATKPVHPLAKFAGTLSDEDAEEMQKIVATERKVDMNEW